MDGCLQINICGRYGGMIMQELINILQQEYGIDVCNVVPHKEHFIVSSPSGEKLLKKVGLSCGRIRFIHYAKEHLYKNGFKNIDRYICTIKGEPFITAEGDNYTLSDFINGKESDFELKEHIIKASKLLASMHSSSKGFMPPADCQPCNYLGALPSYLQKRLNEIRRLLKMANRGKTRFDYLFIKCADDFCKQGEDAINSLNNSGYFALVEQFEKTGGLCHHDFTYNNILLKDGDMWLKNFEYCCLELKVYDLANFIKRKMRKCSWDINEAYVILKEYRSIEDITRDEFDILKIMLQFPQKFWRVINRYYNSNRSWSEKNYTARLEEVIEEAVYINKFLNKFDELYYL